MNNRRFETIDISSDVCVFLKRELERNHAIYDSRNLTREQVRFINSLVGVIDVIDPHYNGWDDTNLADQWYLAGNLGDEREMIQWRKEVISAFLRYGKAKIVTVCQGFGHYSNPWEACYTVTRIPENLRTALHKEYMALTKKAIDQVNEEDLRRIYGITPLIDAIDVRFAGVVSHDILPQGLSIRERWQTARYTDFSAKLPQTLGECAVVYDRYLTLLQGAVRYGVAKIYLGENVRVEEVPLEERTGWLLEEPKYEF